MIPERTQDFAGASTRTQPSLINCTLGKKGKDICIRNKEHARNILGRRLTQQVASHAREDSARCTCIHMPLPSRTCVRQRARSRVINDLRTIRQHWIVCSSHLLSRTAGPSREMAPAERSNGDGGALLRLHTDCAAQWPALVDHACNAQFKACFATLEGESRRPSCQ